LTEPLHTIRHQADLKPQEPNKKVKTMADIINLAGFRQMSQAEAADFYDAFKIYMQGDDGVAKFRRYLRSICADDLDVDRLLQAVQERYEREAKPPQA
jgi:hypothetical protein